jgi:c-di-GMP-binding flagellar brake protein YcgR
MLDTLNTNPEQDPATIEQYGIETRSAIQKLIQTIHSEENELYVHLLNGDGSFVSEIVEIDYDQTGPRGLWIATPFNKSIIRNLPPNLNYIIVSFPDGVKVQLSGTGMELSDLGHTKALKLALPTLAVRIQRRNYFRVLVDAEMSTYLQLDGPVLKGKFDLIDLCVGGCSIYIEDKTLPLKEGVSLGRATLVLPGGALPVPVNLVVRNLIDNPENNAHWSVGCEMEMLHKPDLYRLQRFLLNTERRQRAKHATY